MDFLRQSIDIIWNRIPAEYIIGKYLYDRWSEGELLSELYSRLLVDQYRELTMEEAIGVERQLNENWLKSCNKSDISTSFFHLLIHFTNDILRIRGNEPVCRFEHLLRWWETTQLVGPDLPTTAYLAYYDVRNNIQRELFVWPSVLNHDYALLNVIMQKGLSELHSHLNGASLNFDLQWLSLMNNIKQREKKCKNLEWNKFSSLLELQASVQYSTYSLIVMAAEMRRWLFSEHVLHQHTSLNRCDALPDVGKIDAAIQTLRAEYGHRYKKKNNVRGRIVDYAIDYSLPQDVEETALLVNTLTQGERRILYHSLRYIYGNKYDELYYDTQRVLMAYTSIKSHIRQQLVQVNLRKGFLNFQQYQNDKELFISSGSIYDELLKDVAIKNVFCNYPTNYLEYRIAPKETSLKIYKSFQKLERYKESSYVSNDEIQKRAEACEQYVIVHFIKKPYKDPDSAVIRNEKLRGEICKQALALRTAYKKYRVVRKMLCAIDAANAERDARPEVFAQAFRFLRNELNNYHPAGEMDSKRHHIHITFHVGEDFWDIVDGLRAIDEAILFLEMEGDDRIGHGLALGTNPEEYYRKRHYSVIMPCQVLLDNVVWLYYKAQSLNISLSPSAQLFVDNTVSKMTRVIYGEEYGKEICYQAWQLRGDNPKRISGITDESTIGGWDNYAISTRPKHDYMDIPVSDEVRRCILQYHQCRKRGNKMITLRFEKTLIPIIRDIQDCMMDEIGRKHIAVETNPTSNVRIGDFCRYDQHPIFRFEQHMPVSINTDDVGVFDTSQTNEYALLACAMEKMKNADGSLVYSNSKEICKWLDQIREASVSQRFVKKE